MTRRLVLGLGSNVGDRRAHLAWALECLEERFGALEVAPLYRSAPISAIPQADYLNTVVGIASAFPDGPVGDPQWLALLSQLKAWERQAGRRQGPRFGPRPLDIDVLLHGDLERRIDGPQGAPADTDGLILPHPRMMVRRFVLTPMADLWPHLRLPGGGEGRTVGEQLARIDPAQEVERVPWNPSQPFTER